MPVPLFIFIIPLVQLAAVTAPLIPRLIRILPNCASVIQQTRAIAANPRMMAFVMHGKEFTIKLCKDGQLTLGSKVDITNAELSVIHRAFQSIVPNKPELFQGAKLLFTTPGVRDFDQAQRIITGIVK